MNNYRYKKGGARQYKVGGPKRNIPSWARDEYGIGGMLKKAALGSLGGLFRRGGRYQAGGMYGNNNMGNPAMDAFAQQSRVADQQAMQQLGQDKGWQNEFWQDQTQKQQLSKMNTQMAGQGLQALGADPKAGSAVSGIADMASQYIKLKADDKDPTTVSKQDALAAGLSGAASGAKMGAQMGSMLGPAGTAVGTIAGGIMGLAKGKKGAEEAASEAREQLGKRNRGMMGAANLAHQKRLQNMETMGDTGSGSLARYGGRRMFRRGGPVNFQMGGEPVNYAGSAKPAIIPIARQLGGFAEAMTPGTGGGGSVRAAMFPGQMRAGGYRFSFGDMVAEEADRPKTDWSRTWTADEIAERDTYQKGGGWAREEAFMPHTPTGPSMGGGGPSWSDIKAGAGHMWDDMNAIEKLQMGLDAFALGSGGMAYPASVVSSAIDLGYNVPKNIIKGDWGAAGRDALMGGMGFIPAAGSYAKGANLMDKMGTAAKLAEGIGTVKQKTKPLKYLHKGEKYVDKFQDAQPDIGPQLAVEDPPGPDLLPQPPSPFVGPETDPGIPGPMVNTTPPPIGPQLGPPPIQGGGPNIDVATVPPPVMPGMSGGVPFSGGDPSFGPGDLGGGTALLPTTLTPGGGGGMGAPTGGGLSGGFGWDKNLGVTPGGGGLGAAASGVGDAIGGAAGGVGDAVSGVGSGIGDAVSGVGDTIGDVTSGVGDAVGDVTSGIGDAVGGIGDTLGDVTSGIGDAVSGATDAIGDVTSGIGDAVSGVGDALGDVTDAVGDVVGARYGGRRRLRRKKQTGGWYDAEHEMKMLDIQNTMKDVEASAAEGRMERMQRAEEKLLQRMEDIESAEGEYQLGGMLKRHGSAGGGMLGIKNIGVGKGWKGSASAGPGKFKLGLGKVFKGGNSSLNLGVSGGRKGPGFNFGFKKRFRTGGEPSYDEYLQEMENIENEVSGMDEDASFGVMAKALNKLPKENLNRASKYMYVYDRKGNVVQPGTMPLITPRMIAQNLKKNQWLRMRYEAWKDNQRDRLRNPLTSWMLKKKNR